MFQDRISTAGSPDIAGRWVARIAIGLAVASLLAAGPTETRARAGTITVTTTIQAGVDAANPGDTVLVPPGRYHETVTIAKSGITIRGGKGAILDAAGFPVGIRASSGPITPVPGGFPICPPMSLHDIHIDGLKVVNASFTGVLLRGVDGFSVRDGRYIDNEAYAIFPICSHDGVVEGNWVEGTDDASIYIGDSDDVVIDGNHATDSTVGIEIENTTNTVVTGNTVTGSTAGIVAFVLPGLPIPETTGLRIQGNVVAQNNRSNPLDPNDPDEPAGQIPAGTGILILGADDVLIARNEVIGNDSGGIAIASNPFGAIDPRVDPEPDGVTVRSNVVRSNGLAPDQVRSPFPGADIIYDGSGSAVCFEKNSYGTDFPPGVVVASSCD
jgi:parallel beta-helix repeat protein